jgi:DNA-binding SARP family transcriptional activator
MEFRVLGSLEVLANGVAIPLGGPKQRSVLAILLLEANRTVSADRLVEGLWGPDPPGRAVTTLQVYVSNLRKALEPGRSANVKPSVLLTRPSGYQLAADPEQIDAGRFEALLRDARSAMATTDARRALVLLDDALDLWRGPALVEFAFEEFARADAARLDDLRVVAIEERIEARLALGDHAALVGELEGLVGEHPLRERLWRQLMLAQYRDGREAEALRA